jgi:aminomethyltransferase
VGLGARDTLRLEGRMSLYGNELTLDTTPLETGLSWTVKFDKEDFIGKEALLRQKAAGVRRKIVGFEMVDRAIARHGYPVVAQDAPQTDVGVVTSGSPSPTLNTNIGLAMVPEGRYRIGEELGIRIRDQVKIARVVRTPFYKRPH